MVVHGIPGPYELQARRHPLDRRRRDQRRLGRRRRDHGPDRRRSPGGAQQLLDVTKDVALRGHRADAARQPPRRRLARAIQRAVERDGLSIIRTLVGHGIGRDMHEDPQIPNFGEPGKGPVLEEGMVLAIEPMVNAGGAEVRMGDDGWAVYSRGRLAGRPLRVHGRGHAGRPADPHPLAPGVARFAARSAPTSSAGRLPLSVARRARDCQGRRIERTARPRSPRHGTGVPVPMGLAPAHLCREPEGFARPAPARRGNGPPRRRSGRSARPSRRRARPASPLPGQVESAPAGPGWRGRGGG